MKRLRGAVQAPRRVRVETLETGTHALDVHQNRYLRRVLRLAAGEMVELFDGKGRRARGPLVESEAGWAVEIASIEKDPAPAFTLTLAVAAPKGERADWLVEKVAELGAFELQWIECDRSVVKLAAGSKKLERFRRLADSAARQSGQSFTMAIHAPVSLEAFLERDFQRKWVAHPGGSSAGEGSTTGSGAVLVGPEGGFTTEEVSRAKAAGYLPLGLGPTILRVETAAVAATVLVRAATRIETGD